MLASFEPVNFGFKELELFELDARKIPPEDFIGGTLWFLDSSILLCCREVTFEKREVFGLLI